MPKKDKFWSLYSPELHKILSKSGSQMNTQLFTYHLTHNHFLLKHIDYVWQQNHVTGIRYTVKGRGLHIPLIFVKA